MILLPIYQISEYIILKKQSTLQKVHPQNQEEEGEIAVDDNALAHIIEDNENNEKKQSNLHNTHEMTEEGLEKRKSNYLTIKCQSDLGVSSPQSPTESPRQFPVDEKQQQDQEQQEFVTIVEPIKEKEKANITNYEDNNGIE